MGRLIGKSITSYSNGNGDVTIEPIAPGKLDEACLLW